MAAKRKKKIVRMSASTLKKRKDAYAARALKAKRIAAWQDYEVTVESFNARGEDLPRGLRAPEWIAYRTARGWSVRRRPRRFKGLRPLPSGIARDPVTGQFVSSRDLAATRAYRLDKRRVKRVKAAKRRGLKKDIARARSQKRMWAR